MSDPILQQYLAAPQPRKRVVRISGYLHHKLKQDAKQVGMPLWSLLEDFLEYGLGQLEAQRHTNPAKRPDWPGRTPGYWPDLGATQS